MTNKQQALEELKVWCERNYTSFDVSMDNTVRVFQNDDVIFDSGFIAENSIRREINRGKNDG